jgi:hypothetical protein
MISSAKNLISASTLEYAQDTKYNVKELELYRCTRARYCVNT